MRLMFACIVFVVFSLGCCCLPSETAETTTTTTTLSNEPFILEYLDYCSVNQCSARERGAARDLCFMQDVEMLRGLVESVEECSCIENETMSLSCYYLASMENDIYVSDFGFCSDMNSACDQLVSEGRVPDKDGCMRLTQEQCANYYGYRSYFPYCNETFWDLKCESETQMRLQCNKSNYENCRGNQDCLRYSLSRCFTHYDPSKSLKQQCLDKRRNWCEKLSSLNETSQCDSIRTFIFHNRRSTPEEIAHEFRICEALAGKGASGCEEILTVGNTFYNENCAQDTKGYLGSCTGVRLTAEANYRNCMAALEYKNRQ